MYLWIVEATSKRCNVMVNGYWIVDEVEATSKRCNVMVNGYWIVDSG